MDQTEQRCSKVTESPFKSIKQQGESAGLGGVTSLKGTATENF